MNKCKKCNRKVNHKLSFGMCCICYNYFIRNRYKEFNIRNYDKVNYVQDKGNQDGMVICNLCNRAYHKLGNHLQSFHNISRNEYCDIYGLDHKNKLTSAVYINKMQRYVKENYDKVVTRNLLENGKKTRFKAGNNNTYKRSSQTLKRLSNQGKIIGEKYERK